MDLVLQLLATGLVVGSLYALCALGWGIIYGTTLHFHVAHGAVFTAAAYYAYVGQKVLGLPLIVAVVGAIVAAALSGLLIDRLLYQPLERRGAVRTTLFISSLGLLILVENALAIIFTPDPLRMDIGALQHPLQLGPVFVTYLHVVTVALAIVGYVALVLFLRHTQWGQAIRAVSSAPEMARTVGIDLGRVHLLTYAIGSAISAPAGILVAMDVGAEPYRGTTFVLLASVGVIMGGIGSIPGAMLGGLFLGLIENLGVWQIPSEWQSALSFGAFLVFILVRPRGFFGRKIRTAEI
ncbi:MAG: branched-chain amino acid ABC transporter permease [Candidatus Rokubacteria bacterium]|nr:branched-chain amino acid ABC transporter permease [Candidatus Rokubacteria bacterium]